jgi:RND family efflux transporter MFP subunit
MKRLLAVLIPVIALSGVIAWRLNTKAAEADAQAKQRQARAKMAPMVSTAPVEVRDIVQTYEAVGSIEAPFNVKIAPRVTGRINFLEVREGDRVTKGQVLVRIDPADLNSQLRQQQAALAEARYRLAQAQISQNPNNVSVTTQIRQQEAALTSAQADANQTEQNYNAQLAAAQAAVTDAQGRVSNAEAAIASGKAAIASAKANLENAKVKFDRLTTLEKKGFIAGQDVDDARTQVDVANAAVDVAKEQMNAAVALRDSALAQKQAAQQQADITGTKGRADIEAARAKVTQARAALDYARANRAQMPAYQQSLDALRSEVTAAQAGLRGAEAHMAETVLKAPLDGFITDRYMDPGSLAQPGTPLLAIETMQQVWATIFVPEEVSRKVATGQTATVRFDALPGQTFTGRVTQFNPSADPQSRQFSVRVTLDNPRNLIKPGMFARVTLETERLHGVVVVPREAVQQGNNGTTVLVVSAAGTVQQRPVTTGGSDAAGIAITQGVQPGEKVVTLSAMPLKEGQTVRISGDGEKKKL